MLCNGDNPIIRIVGVEHMKWNGGTFTVEPRPHSALAFRMRGEAVIQSGGEEYRVQSNDIMYLPQNMGYTAEYTDTELIAIHFVAARDDSQVEVYSLQNGEQIYKLFLRARELWKNKQPGFSVYVMGQLYTILGSILAHKTETNLPPSFLKAVSFINANYKNNAISIPMICKEAGIGATVFRQLFRKHYQKTPTAYITDLRLEQARNLISGGMTIENAAWESGFTDPKYFARVVKKRFSCTPRDFKTYGK